MLKSFLSRTFQTFQHFTPILSTPNSLLTLQIRNFPTIRQAMRSRIPHAKKRPSRTTALQGCPFKKGTVQSVFERQPKKPNSAKRKCARVKLSTGEEVSVYIPGEGHNLQKHAIVLVRGGRTQDLPGYRYKAVRGVYDLNAPPNRVNGRSKYGAKKPKDK